ncbi:peptidyl-prolyl cis-trans isomerase C [Arboricoccus pini]|uniref:Parvulin-like PPIase n=1 Tax=Arboricoccus pini TaxID=1963835 RepID=A0A212R6J0_9PROT|nr:peptidylprolyl isomerase [Arboricoccus pini]SNB67695.1 peptidyl-prolyl cis-trans isomerase C [Arboricoccus pini]
MRLALKSLTLAAAIVGGTWLTADAQDASTPPVQAAPLPSPDTVVAVVNGQNILLGDVEAAQTMLPEQYRQVPLQAIFDPLLERLVDARLLAEQAEKDKIEDRPEVKEALAEARRQVLQQQIVEAAVKAGTTDDKLKAIYEKMKGQPDFAQEEVHAHHILLQSEAEAQDVIKQLDKGAKFDELAKKLSKDPSAASNAGDLGWFTRGTMVKEFADAAFTIKPGTVSQTPVQSQFGWHVIRVDEKRTKIPTFEEKEAEIRDQTAREIVTALVADVRKDAKVQTFQIDGSPKPAESAPTTPAAPANP